MATDTTVRARIDAATKEQAVHVLDAMGLTVSDAIRILLTRVAAEKALPFAVRIPNAESRAAIAELEAGKGSGFETVADLMADLHAPD